MRLLAIAVIVLASLPQTRPATAQSKAAHFKAAQDEAAVRAVVLKEIDGWAKFNAEEVASCFAVDVTWQNPFGVRLHSRAQLANFLNDLFQRPGYRSAKDTSAPRITDIHLLSPTTAAVWSEEKSSGQVDDATGEPMPPRYSHYLEVLTKTNGQWLVSDSIIMDEYPRT